MEDLKIGDVIRQAGYYDYLFVVTGITEMSYGVLCIRDCPKKLWTKGMSYEMDEFCRSDFHKIEF